MKRILALLLLGCLLLSGCTNKQEESQAVMPVGYEKKEPQASEKTPTEEDFGGLVDYGGCYGPHTSPIRKVPLTLEAVLEIAKKGNAIEFSDFDPYIHSMAEYRYIYELEAPFSLEIKRWGADNNYYSICLIANVAYSKNAIDLRSKGVEKFVETFKNAAPLNAVEHTVTRAIAKEGQVFDELFQIDSVEEYRAYYGEDSALYDEAYFEKTSQFIFASKHGEMAYNQWSLRVGKFNHSLYIDAIYGYDTSLIDIETRNYTYMIEISKEELKGINRAYYRATKVDFQAETKANGKGEKE